MSVPVDRAGDPEARLALLRAGARSCAEALRKKGIDLAAYNTVESADDLDDLRRALGARRSSASGGSVTEPISRSPP